MRGVLALLGVGLMACQVPSCGPPRALATDAGQRVSPIVEPPVQGRAECESRCAQVPDVEMDAWDDLPPEEAAEWQRAWLEEEREKILRSPEYAECIKRCPRN